jgi:hypothetical protein
MKQRQKSETLKKIKEIIPIQEVFCLTCNEKVQAKRKTTLLGFTQYQCPKCNKKNTYPLDEIICLACNEKVQARLKISPFGYTLYQCPKCDKSNIYPLTVGSYWFYIVGVPTIVVLKIQSIYWTDSLWKYYLLIMILIAGINIINDIKIRKDVKNAVEKFSLLHPEEDKIELEY